MYLMDYQDPKNNDFVVANQWTVVENSEKRPDVVLFVNGLPLVVMELKSPSREETNASAAYRQLRNYMHEIPALFVYNQVCVISDMFTNKAGTITSGEDRFMAWKTKDGSYENTKAAQFDTFFEGAFQKKRFLDILKNFICFNLDGEKTFKILAEYHQYFAVRKAIASTQHATQTDGKGGVFWHTQGSGKSLSMVFYAHLLQQALESPTVVVITDRNDLDDQLYGQFCRCRDFLRQTPQQATSREHLRELLENRQANGIIFTTMQRFEEYDRPLSQRLKELMNRYINGLISNEEVIAELMKMAQDIRQAHQLGQQLGLSQEELAFYDALTKPQAIKDFYEHDELITITKELTNLLRKNRTIDWQKKESVRAGMRRLVKRLLKKHKYPLEGMEDAVQTVMSQCEMWTDQTPFN